MHAHSLRPRAGFALLSLLGVLAGCTGRDVVAQVGRTSITRADLDQFIEATGGRFVEDRAAALDALVDRVRVAEAARRADLDEEPGVRARLAASRREILAAAFLEKQLDPAVREDALRKRYADEKDRFVRRRVHVAHIVTRPTKQGKEARDAAQARIIAAYAKLADGKPFEEVARAWSEDAPSAARGGDLGPLLEGEVDQQLFVAAAALKAGESSRPVESPYGFHILKALAAPSTVTPSFEEVRGRLAAEARQAAEGDAMRQLRSEIDAKVYADRVAPAPRKAAKAGEGR